MTLFEFLSEYWFLVAAFLGGISGVISIVITFITLRGQVGYIKKEQEEHIQDDKEFKKDTKMKLRNLEEKINTHDKTIVKIETLLGEICDKVKQIHKKLFS